jgi:hypothetical protein
MAKLEAQVARGSEPLEKQADAMEMPHPTFVTETRSCTSVEESSACLNLAVSPKMSKLRDEIVRFGEAVPQYV